MEELLRVISDELEKLEINYDYIEYKTAPYPYPYVVGEYYENNYIDEEHKSEGEILLTIWDRNKSNKNIVDLNVKIKNHFRNFISIRNNTTIHISYSNSLPVIQEAENLRKQEVRLDVEYWEGGN